MMFSEDCKTFCIKNFPFLSLSSFHAILKGTPTVRGVPFVYQMIMSTGSSTIYGSVTRNQSHLPLYVDPLVLFL